jgi:hypothetical protein
MKRTFAIMLVACSSASSGNNSPVDTGTPVEDAAAANPYAGEHLLTCSGADRIRVVGGQTAGSVEKYVVPKEANPYRCWVFQSPATETHVTDYAPIIDAAAVVHHIILFTAPRNPYATTGPEECSANPAGSRFTWGWAPGGTNFSFPKDVDQIIPANSTLIVQVHYNNKQNLDLKDASGVALCNGAPRARHTGVTWTGSAAISIPPKTSDHSVTGTCPPAKWGDSYKTFPMDVEILGAAPHMHQRGKTIRTDVVDKDGKVVDTLANDTAWNFNNQGFQPYAKSKIVPAGAHIETKCTWDNPTPSTITFGPGTEDEMCFTFLYTIPDLDTWQKGASYCL